MEFKSLQHLFLKAREDYDRCVDAFRERVLISVDTEYNKYYSERDDTKNESCCFGSHDYVYFFHLGFKLPFIVGLHQYIT